MKRNSILILGILCSSVSQLAAQIIDDPRTNDLRFRWNIGQFANIGRYAFQFGLEKDFTDNKTLSAEIGLSFFRGTSSLAYQRYNYKGVQGLVEYRNYFRGFHDQRVKPYIGLGVFARQLAFDADVILGYNVTRVRDFNSASHFEETTAAYKTTAVRMHAEFGFRLPISPMMYFEANGGPAFGFYNVSNDIKRNIPYVIDNFYNPFFMSSQTGSYFSPALYGSISFGFVLSRDKNVPKTEEEK